MIGVIGGGIQSLVAAWSLLRMGEAVTIYERGVIGDEASKVAAAMLTAVGEGDVWHQKLMPLLEEARQLWDEFAAAVQQESRMDIDYRKQGLIFLALNRDELESLRHRYGRDEFNSRGCWLTRAELAKREPFVARNEGGWFCEDEASVDSRLTMRALRAIVERRGCVIKEHAVVESIVCQKGEISGLRVGGEWHPMKRVIVAAGAWSATLDGLPSLFVSWVRPVKGQIITLRMGSHSASKFLLSHMIAARGCYSVPRGDGRLLLGASVEESGFVKDARAGIVFDLLARGREFLPILDEMEFVRVETGLRPATLDGMPLVGAVPKDWGMKGLFLATGHYRNGVLLAPLTARAVEQWIKGETETETETVSYEAMSPCRLHHKVAEMA